MKQKKESSRKMDYEPLPQLKRKKQTQELPSDYNFARTYKPNYLPKPIAPHQNQKVLSKSLTFSISPTKGKFYNASTFGLSNIRLRPLQNAHTHFQKSIIAFCDQSKIDSNLELTRARSQFDKSFEMFVQYITVIFNSQHPNDDPHILLAHSAVMNWTRRLIADWTKFVRKMNEVASGKQKISIDQNQLPLTNLGSSISLVPVIFPQIYDSLNELKNCLDIILDYYYVGSINSPISEQTMKFLDDKIIEIEHIIIDQISTQQQVDSSNTQQQQSMTIGTKGYTVQTFSEKCFDVINRIQSLFLKQMPMHRSKAGNIINAKMNLTISLNNFSELIKALYNFTIIGGTARSAIIEMNTELTNIFKELGLPFELKMDQNNENESSDSDLNCVLGISKKVSEENAKFFFTDINSQIQNNDQTQDEKYVLANRKVSSPTSDRRSARSPRKPIRK